MVRKLFLFLVSFLIISAPFLSNAFINKSFAAWNCTITNNDPSPLTTDDKFINNLTIDTNEAIPGNQYYVYMDSKGGTNQVTRIDVSNLKADSNKNISINSKFDTEGRTGDNPELKFEIDRVVFFVTDHNLTKFAGTLDKFRQKGEYLCETKLTVVQGSGEGSCRINLVGSLKPGELITVKVDFTDPSFRGPSDQKFDIGLFRPSDTSNEFVEWANGNAVPGSVLENEGFELRGPGSNEIYSLNSNQYIIKVHRDGFRNVCKQSFFIDSEGGYIGCSKNSDCNDGLECLPPENDKRLCGPKQPYDYGFTSLACKEDPESDNNFICNTAIGEFSTSPEKFAQSVLQLFLGLAGGILIVLIMLNGYKFMTSQGDPEKIKDARDGIIAAISGVLLIIFSLAILQIITADILKLPGFGT